MKNIFSFNNGSGGIGGGGFSNGGLGRWCSI